MSRNTIIAIIVGVLLLAAAGGAFAYVAVSSNEPAAEEPAPARTSPAEPTPSQIQPEPAEETLDEGQDEDPLAADREAMEALGMEVAEIMTTWDPNEDFNRTAAEMRARDLMTEELAESITAPERPATGEEWLGAAEAGATSQPTAKPNRATSNEVVSIEVTWVWVNEAEDVISNPTDRRLYFFNFEQGQDGELLVSDFNYDTV